MLRLAALFLFLHAVSSQVPSTCPTCNREKANLIGKVTCDAQGRLSAECTKGLIQMEVSYRIYFFNRVTCIGGEWFGTSCDGIAVYLSTVLPDSTCPDIDYPEQNLGATQCKIRPIGLPSAYDNFFANFPQESSPGSGFSCDDQYHWHRFRQSDPTFGVTFMTYLLVSASGEIMFDVVPQNRLSCELNPATSKYELRIFGGSFIGTNQLECMYRKCPTNDLVYNTVTGRCDPPAYDSNACGRALVTSLDSYPLARDGTTNIPSNVTHIVAYPGCKISVFGSKSFPNNPEKIPLVFEQESGLWAINSVIESDPNYSLNLPTSVVCERDGTSTSAPVLMTDLSVQEYTISHESRYLSMPIGQTAPFSLTYWNKALEPGLSFSLFGSGSGVLNVYFGGTLNFLISLDFAAKKLSYNFTQISSPVFGERDLLINSQNFHARFVIVELDLLEVHVNGRFVFSYSDSRLDFDDFRIIQSNVVVDKCDFFVPKRCEKGHRFSEKTGDCEWIGTSSRCALATVVGSGSGNSSWTNAFLESNSLPGIAQFKASFIEVRQGCIAYAFNGEDVSPQIMNGDMILNHWRGRYNFPNLASGTCHSLERGLMNIECYCEDYNKNPGHSGALLEVPVYLADNFVFTASLTATSPMAQFGLVHADGSMGLVLIMAEGKMIATNQPVKGGCLEGELVKAETFPVKKYDRFECRIRMAEYGFEIRINGVAVMVYPYHNGFDGHGNYHANQIVKARFINGLSLVHHRSDREMSYIDGGPAHRSLNIIPFHIGEYLHLNAMSEGPFNITLAGFDVVPADPDTPRKSRFVLDADLSQNKIVQKLYTKKGVKTVTSSCSIFAGVEFDIVVINKPHSMEVYVNGVILPILGENLPEEKYEVVDVGGATVKIFDLRKGPKKLENPPVWANAG